MRKLLIPLDGSELAEMSLGKGLDQFRGELFEIHLLRCIDLNDPIDYSNDFLPDDHLEEERHHSAEATVGKYLEKCAGAPRDRGHSVESHVLTGDPTELILHFAETEDIDCIVMSSNGLSGWKRLRTTLIGSNVCA